MKKHFVKIGDTITVESPAPKLDGDGEWCLEKVSKTVKVKRMVIEIDGSNEWFDKVGWKGFADPKKINLIAIQRNPKLTIWLQDEKGDYYAENEVVI